MNLIRSLRRPVVTLTVFSLATLAACGGSSESNQDALQSPEVPAQSAIAQDGEFAGIAADATRAAVDALGDGASAAATRESPKAIGVATPKVAIIAWSNYATASQQEHVARFDLALLALPQTAAPATVDAAVSALKARNASLQVAQITNLNQVADSFTPLSAQASRNDWWLKTAAGRRVASGGVPGVFDINFTAFADPDDDGKRYPQVKADIDSTTFFKASPAIDYVFANWVAPQVVNADWRSVGTNQAWSDAAVQAEQRAGHAAYWDALRGLHPNLKVLANMQPEWQNSGEFAGKTHGAYLNSVIGRPWSIETVSGWQAVMARYRATMANSLAPKAVIFNMAAAANDYQSMRYGLASALLDDGYFSLTATDGAQPAPWLDEFSAPIGSAAAPPPTEATPSGIWTRLYSHGLVLVNPSKTASATITVPAGYRRLSGTQAPAINNGAAAVTVTLAPRDGLLLVKSGSELEPSVPDPVPPTPPVPAPVPPSSPDPVPPTPPAPIPPSLPPGPGDTQDPTPPGKLVATGVTCRALTLSWAASSDNIGVTSYDIYHDGQQMKSVSANTLSTELTLVPGAKWGFYVNARDAAGNVSQASPILSVLIPQCQTDTAAPTAPTDVRGRLSGTTAYLNWNASTDGIGVSGYDVFRDDAKVGSTSSLSFTDSGLRPNTTVRYALVARDAAGNTSARSVALTLTTGAVCANDVCQVTDAASDTDIPWGLAVLPDGSVFYSRRDALDIVRMNPATGVKTPLGKMPNAKGTNGEGGVLGIAISPNFPATDTWLYVYYTTAVDNRIVRVQYKNGVLDLSTLKVLLSGIGRNAYHNGGRLRYGPDGKLYVATGDAQNADSAQNVKALTGKILRMNPDGSVPADNPFGNYVWSYGHRNPQGLAFDAQGRLWQQEFGNSLMDETNLIQKGGNYGWPNCEGTASKAGNGCATSGYIAPKLTYATSAGSCSGIAVVRNALYVACTRGARLYRAEISGTSLSNVQQLFVGTYGRLRTVEPSIDGALWMTSTNADNDNITSNSNNKIMKVILGN